MSTSGIIRTFTSEPKLIEWLEDRNLDCGGPEEFLDWLCGYFENGNEIEVDGKFYDYLDCVELI